jgi:hypothetical protein
MKLTCSAVEDLLDLYAVDECDSSVKKDIRAHLVECTSCRHRLEEARQLVGLLDLHHRAEAGLARLKRSLQKEAPRRSAVILPWPHAQRLAAVAALLLVVLGLGLILPGLSPSPARPPRLVLALASSLEQANPAHAALTRKAVPAAKAFGPLSPKGVIDLEGRTAAELGFALEHKKEGELPLPPRVSLELTLSNPGPEAVVVQFDRADVQLDLRGPEVRREKANEARRAKPDQRMIPPEGNTSVVLNRLVSRSRGEVVYLYPTLPGDYTLTAHIRVPVWREGEPQNVWTLRLKAGPMTLRVRERR